MAAASKCAPAPDKRLFVYPLKFRPVFQQRIWGGQRLRAVLGKPLPPELHKANVGESWELADLPAGTVKADSTGAAADGSLSSVITNGPLAGKTLHQAIRENPQEIMGDTPLHDGYFPLLIKFLDSQADLSIQVHPDRKYCAANAGAHLKSEAWYILHAEPGAKIYKGLKPDITRAKFRDGLQSGNVEPLLNAVRVRTGDCHYLESGTVHALGAGIVAAEVQTPSDTTFRVFDWNRLDPNGKPRKLHIEEAMNCIAFAEDPALPTVSTPTSDSSALVACDYFTIERRQLEQGIQQDLAQDGPTIWMILKGQGVLLCDDAPPTAYAVGDTILLPAHMRNPRVRTVASTSYLQVRLPAKSR
jgi:mannose-6-phosphate isomerase